MNKTLRNKTKKCMKSYCKKFVKMGNNNIQDIINISKTKIKKINKQLISVKSEDLRKELQLLKKINKILISHLYKKVIHSKSVKNHTLRICKDVYCNPYCKKTIFENGKKISNKTFKNYKKTLQYYLTKKISDRTLMKEFKTEKRRIFGKKENVLKDNFYEKINPVNIKKMKKVGAISGCIEPTFPIQIPK
jgi:hypothetical protein